MDYTTVRVSKPHREKIEEVRERHQLRSTDEAVGLILVKAGEP